MTFTSQGGGGGGTGRDISVMLSGSNPETLQKAAHALVEQMAGVKGVDRGSRPISSGPSWWWFRGSILPRSSA